MQISWFCPYADEPNKAIGVAVDCVDETTGKTEFIPYPIDGDQIDEILKRGPDWLLDQLPLDFPVFPDSDKAERFMYRVFLMMQSGIKDPLIMEILVSVYGGEMRDKSEYGYELRFDGKDS